MTVVFTHPHLLGGGGGGYHVVLPLDMPTFLFTFLSLYGFIAFC